MGIILRGMSRSDETKPNLVEFEIEKWRLRLGNEDVQYILMCVQNLENEERNILRRRG
jgi:hypothetical protein